MLIFVGHIGLIVCFVVRWPNYYSLISRDARFHPTERENSDLSALPADLGLRYVQV